MQNEKGVSVPSKNFTCVSFICGIISESIQAAIVRLDPAAGSQTRPADEIVSTSLSEPKFRTVLVAIFGAVALGISIIGIYGVVSTATTSETKSIGIRMSLGARPRDVLAMIVRREMAVTLVGLVLGTVLSLVLMRFFQSLFYEVRASDPAAFATVAARLALAALAAIWLSANRAARPGCRSSASVENLPRARYLLSASACARWSILSSSSLE